MQYTISSIDGSTLPSYKSFNVLDAGGNNTAVIILDSAEKHLLEIHVLEKSCLIYEVLESIKAKFPKVEINPCIVVSLI